MHYTWRFTKYNPLFRDENGRFLQNDWTSLAEVGKTLAGNNDQFVSVEEYLSLEKNYIEAILTFMRALHISALQVSALEKNNKTSQVKNVFSKSALFIPPFTVKIFSPFFVPSNRGNI